MLVEHTITYKNGAFLNDVIRIETKVLSSEGVKSIRQVTFFKDKTELLLAQSKTTWCLMDKATHRPKRITEEVANLFN